MPWKLTSPELPSWVTFGVRSTKLVQLRAFTGRFCNHLLIHGLGDFRLLHVQHLRGCLDLDRGAGGAHFQREIDGQRLADDEGNAGGLDLAEIRRGCIDLVVTRQQERCSVEAGAIGRVFVGDVGVGIDYGHGCARNGSLGRVVHGSVNCARARRLRGCENAGKRHDKRRQTKHGVAL